ncbi:Protein of unknown function [Chitinophaga costaii]|uniref:DUF2911 domain-containing protein n=1 Tax=Chitinophaga costaii TaxID=1335309 RepID=A0A1C4EP03_9BACT|nr:DUF2911 domain-containing protein [Chitinophaga costaii]PUZ22484.1 DUF2911 domain-containing protein [Chitinophaga costaii]SCC45355.1 Protein of unknown function [Chitinophaga costaii]
MKTLHVLLLLLGVATTSTVFAQDQKPRASAHSTVTGANIKVVYGQPKKKGRDIFGGLVPYGQVWRLGADEATEITFDKDATFGGKPVKKGTYTLFAIPTATTWTFILNGKLGQWGAFDYEKNKAQDVLSVVVPSTQTTKEVEVFTITLPAGKLVLDWDKTHVEVPVKF